MTRIVVALMSVAAGLLSILMFVAPGAAQANPPPGGTGTCNILQDTCTVGAGGGQKGGSGGESGSGVDPCAKYPGAVVGEGPPQISQACAAELHATACQRIIDTTTAGLGRPPAQWTLTEVQSTNAGLAAQGCAPVVTPVMLANQAYKTMTTHLASPSGDRSPSQNQRYRGYPFTYTGLWTFWWTSSGSWTTRSATASAAGVTATVTARPVALVYDPGDGSAAVTCSGPGRPWTQADGNGVPSAGACAYQYQQVTSSPITSTQTIIWKITWTGTGGAGGQFPQLTTSTSGQLNVMQIQTVVTR